MINLKGCPFCGFDHPTIIGNREDSFQVKCPLCGAATISFACCDIYPDDPDDGYDALAMAVSAWNLRSNKHE